MLPVLPSLHSLSLSSNNVEAEFAAEEWQRYNAARLHRDTKRQKDGKKVREAAEDVREAAESVKDENFTDNESFTITLKLNHFVQMWQFGILVEEITNARALGKWLMKLMGDETSSTKENEGMAIVSELFLSSSDDYEPTFEFGFHPQVGPATGKAPLVKIMEFFSRIFGKAIDQMTEKVSEADLGKSKVGGMYVEFSEDKFGEFKKFIAANTKRPLWNTPIGNADFLFDYTYLVTKEVKSIEVKQRTGLHHRVLQKVSVEWKQLSDMEKATYVVRGAEVEEGKQMKQANENYIQEFTKWNDDGRPQGQMPLLPEQTTRTRSDLDGFNAFKAEKEDEFKKELERQDAEPSPNTEVVYTFTKVENSEKIRNGRKVENSEKREAQAPAGPGGKLKAPKVAKAGEDKPKKRNDPIQTDLGELWKGMTPEQQAPYIEEAEEQMQKLRTWKAEGEKGEKPKGGLNPPFLFTFVHREDAKKKKKESTDWRFFTSKEEVRERYRQRKAKEEPTDEPTDEQMEERPGSPEAIQVDPDTGESIDEAGLPEAMEVGTDNPHPESEVNEV